jgi:hypothetical protein
MQGVTTTLSPASAPPRVSSIGRRVGWGLMTVLSVVVGAYALFLVATGFEFVPASVTTNAFPSALGLRTHIAAAGLALLTGPFQFLRPLRQRFPVVHRWMGRVYVAACLVGGVAAGLIALFTTSGLVAGTGFLAAAIAWLACTVLAFVAVRRRNFVAHQRWMTRSYAIAFGAVTLRMYLTLGMMAGLEFAQIYPYVAWLCWVPNVLLVLTCQRQKRL